MSSTARANQRRLPAIGWRSPAWFVGDERGDALSRTSRLCAECPDPAQFLPACSVAVFGLNVFFSPKRPFVMSRAHDRFVQSPPIATLRFPSAVTTRPLGADGRQEDQSTVNSFREDRWAGHCLLRTNGSLQKFELQYIMKIRQFVKLRFRWTVIRLSHPSTQGGR